MVALVVALVALAPTASALAPNVPLTVRPVVVPRFFSQVAPNLPPGQVLLTYPMASAQSQTPLVWQAVSGLAYRMVGGGGPAGTVARAGKQQAGFKVLQQASVNLGPPPPLTGKNLEAVRRAIGQWGVTMVVVPDLRHFPSYLRGRSTAYAVALFTTVLGSAPRARDGAFVWSGVGGAPGPLFVPRAVFAHCAQGPPSAAAGCVLAAAGY